MSTKGLRVLCWGLLLRITNNPRPSSAVAGTNVVNGWERTKEVIRVHEHEHEQCPHSHRKALVLPRTLKVLSQPLLGFLLSVGLLGRQG